MNGLYWMDIWGEQLGEAHFVVARRADGSEAFRFSVPWTDKVFFYRNPDTAHQKWVTVDREFTAGKYQLWEATSAGELVPNPDAALFRSFGLDFVGLSSIAHYRDKGRITAFSFLDGFHVYDQKTGTLHDLGSQYDYLKYNRGLFFDRQNNLWVCPSSDATTFGFRRVSFCSYSKTRKNCAPCVGSYLMSKIAYGHWKKEAKNSGGYSSIRATRRC
jgi:hypothetical protein